MSLYTDEYRTARLLQEYERGFSWISVMSWAIILVCLMVFWGYLAYLVAPVTYSSQCGPDQEDNEIYETCTNAATFQPLR